MASDSPKLSTDGQMLFSADGKELLYSLAAGNQERVVVPNTVRKIAKGAFRYAACTDISFENPDVSVAQNAFDSCEWFEKQKDYCEVWASLRYTDRQSRTEQKQKMRHRTKFKSREKSWVWQHRIPKVGKLSQEDHLNIRVYSESHLLKKFFLKCL